MRSPCCLCVCLRLQFLNNLIAFHKVGMDVVPPEVINKNMAGARTCEVGLTLTIRNIGSQNMASIFEKCATFVVVIFLSNV
jgi:hypothetical protein